MNTDSDLIDRLVEEQYGYNVQHYQRLSVGIGSNAYMVDTDHGKFILKNNFANQMNHPELEPELCGFLREKGIPVSEFLPNKLGQFVWENNGSVYHLQKYVEGATFGVQAVPDWLMAQSAQMLGKIHAALIDYPPLPIGIGEDFFRFMTPARAFQSYKTTLLRADAAGDLEISSDLRYRIDHVRKLDSFRLDLSKFTRGNTHGDYFVSQLICRDNQVAAVIDWTTACIHPLVWEIMRSFVYAEPSCVDGDIDARKLIAYIKEYLSFSPLTAYDLTMMPYLFYYQIGVCDYYDQYYRSTNANRQIHLQQATLSTKLMRWFEQHVESLSDQLSRIL